MKQALNTNSSQQAAERREGYYDYMLRRYREEENAIKTVEERENIIADLKFRIRKLEEDMAHVLKTNA